MRQDAPETSSTEALGEPHPRSSGDDGGIPIVKVKGLSPNPTGFEGFLCGALVLLHFCCGLWLWLDDSVQRDLLLRDFSYAFNAMNAAVRYLAPSAIWDEAGSTLVPTSFILGALLWTQYLAHLIEWGRILPFSHLWRWTMGQTLLSSHTAAYFMGKSERTLTIRDKWFWLAMLVAFGAAFLGALKADMFRQRWKARS